MGGAIEPANAQTNIVRKGSWTNTIEATTSYDAINISRAELPLPHTSSRNKLKWRLRKLLGIQKGGYGHGNKDDHNKLSLSSLAMIYTITLVSEGSRGLVLPSTWPYFKSVGGTKQLLGVFVGVLSLGRMFITIPFGYCSDKFSSETIFYITSSLQIVGHFMYIAFPSVPTLILARFIVGLGSSTVSICRAHIAKQVEKKNRTHHYAYLSALQFIGFSVLPGFGTLLSYLPETSILGDTVQLNGFTYPAFILMICCVGTMCGTFLFYDDPPRSISSSSSAPYANTTPSPFPCAPQASNSGIELNAPNEARNSQQQQQSSMRKKSYLTLIVCLLTNMTFRGSVAELETITAPFLIEQYGLTYGQSGLYITLFGIIGLFVYVFFKPLSARCSDRQLMLIGVSCTLAGSLPLALITDLDIPLVVYTVFIGILWAVAYPIGQTGGLSLFSKSLTGLGPGSLLGVFSASGSGARIVFAVLAGWLWACFGRAYVFLSIAITCVVSLSLIIFSWSKLN